MINLREHPGYRGMFTRDEAEGAYRNGTRVIKTASEPGDGHPVGATATVLGSISHPPLGIMYFVEWDRTPKFAIAVLATKISLTI